MRQILSGVRVMDFTSNAAGPSCTALLADFGATVIKVERPKRGDDNRFFAPLVNGESVVHCWCNRGKMSITLNLQEEEGQRIAKELCLTADIIVESYRPGLPERFGLDYPSISKEKPDIVYCSISAYGQKGPYAKKPGYDLIAQAVSGIADLVGEPDEPPTKSGVVLGDYWGGLSAFNGVLTAWYHKLRTGEGQLIDASLTQNLVYLNHAVLAVNTGYPTSRISSRNPKYTPYNIFQGKGNQYAMITVTKDEQWDAFTHLLDQKNLLGRSLLWRNENWKQVEELVTTWLAGFEHIGDGVRYLEEAGIPALEIGTTETVVNNPHVKQMEWVVDIEMPKGVTSPSHYQGRSIPINLSRTPGIIKQAPNLGQHNYEVLSDLGLSSAEISRIQEEGAKP